MRRIVLIVLLLFFLPSGARAGETVEIGSFEELSAFADRVARGELTDARVRLAADIAASRPLRAVGSALFPFQGEFDGAGHAIENLIVFGPRGSQGLFGFLGPDGAVKNLTLRRACVMGASYTGCLAGYSAGVIENCRVEDSRAVCLSRARFGTAAGCLAGLASGRISLCAALRCTARAPANTGGLVGALHAGLLSDSVFAGLSVGLGAGEAPCGGLAGSLHGGARIRRCVGFGAALAFLNEYTGGVAGGLFHASAEVCAFFGPVISLGDRTGAVAGCCSAGSQLAACLYDPRLSPIRPVGSGPMGTVRLARVEFSRIYKSALLKTSRFHVRIG